MAKIFITRQIPKTGPDKLRASGHEVVVSEKDGVLTKDELVVALQGKEYDAVLCLLTDKIDDDIFIAAGTQCKIFANYAVGFDNINLDVAKVRGIMITNTPGVLTDTVAEHAFALMLSIAHRVAEADRFTRAGKYTGWAPMMLLGTDVSKKTIGIVGLGRIGSRVAYHAAKGFDAKIIYYDIRRDENFEKEFSAEFKENVDDIFREADFISIHVPLLPTTKHLVDARRLGLMKNTAYLINTSRGPIVDEKALADALSVNIIKGAAIDVFEHEPAVYSTLLDLENIILTPHIASATDETRSKMAELAADNIISALLGQTPPNLVK
ncbi:MAG: D-glycerate dehydrogenase [Patescibacteria group bacterium]